MASASHGMGTRSTLTNETAGIARWAGLMRRSIYTNGERELREEGC